MTAAGPTSDTAAVHIRDLVKVFKGETGGDIRAVDGVSLEIRAGEIFGLLGPNGAGKTTTIRILATLARPTAGLVRIFGREPAAEPDAVRKLIGYVSQEVAVDRTLTGRENLALQAGLFHLRGEEARSRIDEVLALVELADRADDVARGYSGGMKKRLDLAIGLLHRPRLLLLDEPTLGLDIQTRRRIWDFVQRLRAGGTTILLTTHYLEEADRLCDRIAIVDRGRIRAEGPPAKLKEALGAHIVSVRLATPNGTAADVEAALRGLDFVAGVKTIGGGPGAGGDAGAEVAIRPGTSGDAAVAAVLKTLEARGAPVARLGYAAPTLDDVFLWHTGHELTEARGAETGAQG